MVAKCYGGRDHGLRNFVSSGTVAAVVGPRDFVGADIAARLLLVQVLTVRQHFCPGSFVGRCITGFPAGTATTPRGKSGGY